MTSRYGRELEVPIREHDPEAKNNNCLQLVGTVRIGKHIRHFEFMGRCENVANIAILIQDAMNTIEDAISDGAEDGEKEN